LVERELGEGAGLRARSPSAVQLHRVGSDMDKDVNLIIDVDPEEAQQLIGLIETLLAEWYVRRHR
jgi:hypothetical protein